MRPLRFETLIGVVDTLLRPIMLIFALMVLVECWLIYHLVRSIFDDNVAIRELTTIASILFGVIVVFFGLILPYALNGLDDNKVEKLVEHNGRLTKAKLAQDLRWREKRLSHSLKRLRAAYKIRRTDDKAAFEIAKRNPPRRPPDSCENCASVSFSRLKRGSRLWRCEHCQTVARGQPGKRRKGKKTQTTAERAIK